MKRLGLVSAYTVAAFRPCKAKCNESATKNELNRCFHGQEKYAVVVSDLTYVGVNYRWNYVCVFIDLYNREIIGFSAGPHKDAALVYDAFATVKGDLSKIQMFHTNRGSEFKNQIIDEMLGVFHIKRSLSMKGYPYNNAVAEANFKMLLYGIVLTFQKQQTFIDFEYSCRIKITRREEFLEIMVEIIPRDAWAGVIAPYSNAVIHP